MKAVVVSRVSKSYGRKSVLENVNFDIDKGSCVGLIGPNGAGKTTLIKIVVGLLKPTSGKVSVFGENPAVERGGLVGRIAYVPEKAAVYEKMTAVEYLRFFAALRGMGVNVRGILAEYGLTKKGDDRISTFSRGMKRRLELARALMDDPEILVLDEPFSGIDLESRIAIREAIRNSRSKLIVVSSHDLREVERIADSVVVVKEGRIVFQGDIEKLISSKVNLTIQGVFDGRIGEILEKFGAEVVESRGNRITLNITRDRMPMLIRELSSRYELFDISSDGIESAFVELLNSE